MRVIDSRAKRMRNVDFNQKPYVELFDGEARVKVPPLFGPHGLAATSIAVILRRCSGDRGFVSVEPHMRLGAVDGTDTVFVPDVAYVERERFRDVSGPDAMPEFSPDIAVEVRSPCVSAAQLRRKIAKYLACGCALVLDVDPAERTILAHVPGEGVRRFVRGETFDNAEFPWLHFDVAEAFAEVDAFDALWTNRP